MRRRPFAMVRRITDSERLNMVIDRHMRSNPLRRVDRVTVERVPPLYAEGIKPAFGLRGFAEVGVGATAPLDASVGEVEIPPFALPTADEIIQVMLELFEPALDLPLGIKFDGLDAEDVSLMNDDAAYYSSIAGDSADGATPAIAEKLGAQVPLLCPVGFEAPGCFFIPNASTAVVYSKHINPAAVDEGVVGNWMAREAGEIQRDAEGKFDRLSIIELERLDMIARCGPF